MEELEERNEEEKREWKEYWRDGFLSVTKLQREKTYFQKKIIYEYILSKQISVNRKQIDKIYTLLEKGGSLSYDLKKFWKFKDRKSTRLNSSHANISYAVFCLKKIINFTIDCLVLLE